MKVKEDPLVVYYKYETTRTVGIVVVALRYLEGL